MKTSKFSLIFLGIFSYAILGLGWALNDSMDNVAQAEVTFNLAQPDANQLCSLAVIECPNEAITGAASFYDYELANGWSSVGHRVAAMRDVPRGTMVRVTNMENGKSVEVLIADYGPSLSLYQERVIDLSSYAFSQLAPLHEGIIQEVKIELL